MGTLNGWHESLEWTTGRIGLSVVVMRSSEIALQAARQQLSMRKPTVGTRRIETGISKSLTTQIATMKSFSEMAKGGTVASQMKAAEIAQRTSGLHALRGLRRDIGVSPGIGLAQASTMKSFSEMAKGGTVASQMKAAEIAQRTSGLHALRGLRRDIGVSPGIGLAQASTMKSVGAISRQLEWQRAASTKGLAFGMADASMQVQMRRIGNQMGNSWIRTAFGDERLAKRLETGMRSISKEFDVPSLLGARGFNGLDLLKGPAFASMRAVDIRRSVLASGLWRYTQATLESLLMAELAHLWSRDPLWFLIGNLNPRRVPALLERTRDEVYEAVLDGLEATVRNSGLAEELLDACEEIGFLSFEQRAWLKHGLELARDGEWLLALPPLILGFEGAIFNGAVAANAWAITGGKEPAAEKVIRAIDLDDALREFTIRLVFGGRGNAVRHGRPKNDAREQVLLQVVALIGWVDSSIGTEGTARLAHSLEPPLASSLEAGARRDLTAA